MNKTFLQYVAERLYDNYGDRLPRMSVVFPNKRAALFLNDALAQLSDRPVWCPHSTTISELFRSHSKLQVGNPIQLVCELYKVFVEVTGSHETLDQFYGWGNLLLADFDDIDKNLADAQQVFANLRDYHDIDTLEYLTDRQRDALREFFGNFADDGQSTLRQRFLSLWSKLGEIYQRYNKHLTSLGLAYEGALYRSVAESTDNDYRYDCYAFVGFNLLQEVEKKLFSQLKEQGKAIFFWDFDKHYMNEQGPGRYIMENLRLFPNELDNSDSAIYDNLSRPKDITYISAPTEDIQARYIGEWLKDEERVKAGRRTAIVMCDESILKTVIHCIPPEVQKINITTGYPLAQSPAASWVKGMINLQLRGYNPSTRQYRLRYANILLRHPFAKFVSEQSASLTATLNTEHNLYPQASELRKDEGLCLLFTDVYEGNRVSNRKLLHWITDTLKWVGQHGADSGDPLFQETVFRMFTLVNTLTSLVENGSLLVDTVTLQRLINQLISTTTVPFHGEPAEGLQVMGVLETRNLDFDHVLMLSCNEGNMPKGVNDASFIPHSIRQAYGLTTIEKKTDIYAYYFYRLLQRASDITIEYNSAVDNGHTGVMSQFMLQMLVENGKRIHRKSLQAGQTPNRTLRPTVPKDEQIMRVITKIDKLYPSDINRYLRCPLSFYYKSVLELREEDDIDEDEIDNRVFGNIFHKTAQLIYSDLSKDGRTVNPDQLKNALRDLSYVERYVDEAFSIELFKDKQQSHHNYNGLQYINRETVKTYIRKLLEYDRNLGPFQVLGLEKKVSYPMCVQQGEWKWEFSLSGIIDRLDKVKKDGSELIRVVDYKTGKKKDSDPVDMDEVFSPKTSVSKHGDYYLQSTLYSMIERKNLSVGEVPVKVRPALLYIQKMYDKDFDPLLCLGKEPLETDAQFRDFSSHLQSLLEEILNPQTPFTPTDDQDRCRNCPYSRMCY